VAKTIKVCEAVTKFFFTNEADRGVIVILNKEITCHFGQVLAHVIDPIKWTVKEPSPDIELLFDAL
jgi:hypothetical protein